MLGSLPFAPKRGDDLDDFSHHEALDRASLLASMVDDWLLAHPYIAADKSHSRRARKAIKHLVALYQEIGIGAGE